MKKSRKAFSLIELTIVLATVGILITATLTTIDSIRTERGLAVGAELRTLHLAQKHFLIQALDSPGNIDLSTLTLSDLQNRGLAPNPLPAVEKAGVSSLNVGVMPPIFTGDGSFGDSPKTDRTNGDLLYDIGPE